MRNKLIIIISIIMLTTLNVFLILKKDNNIVEKNKVIKIERKEFNIYLQKTVGSKDYDPSTDTTFPTSGYLLNTTKTMCYGYNGNKLNSNPVTQELTDGVINGSITINSKNTIYCDLYFDKNETPTINTFNVTGKTSGGTTLSNSFTYQTDNIPFTVTYTDNESDVKQYCINETNSTANCNWQTLSETSGTYTLIDKNDGEKTMYIYLKDKANNVSTPSNKSITVDRTAPVVNTFKLTGTADEGQQLSDSAQYTHKAGITYDAKITETNISEYCVYEDSCSYQTTTSTSFSKVSYTLTNTEGSHSVKIRVKDKAGNESEINTTSTKSITLDKTNPTATISQNSVTTESITVTVGYSGTEALIGRQCKINNQSTWKDADVNGDCTIDSLDNKTELKDGTEYTIQARVKDGSGRWSTNNPSVKVATDKKLTPGKQKAKDVLGVVPNGISDVLLGDMYRFVGTKGQVDNWVCFGYSNSETDCGSGGSDYMYSIIGITPDGQMKLIKGISIYEGSNYLYKWHKSYKEDITWPDSDIFRRLNGLASGTTQGSKGDTNLFINSKTSNVTYLQVGNSWYNKMDSEHEWFYGAINGSNLDKTADEIYKIESGRQKVQQNYREEAKFWDTKVQAAVGLMYVSDYYYSYATNGSDSSTTNCYSNQSCKDSWIGIGGNGSSSRNLEWTMTSYGRDSDGWHAAWYVKASGGLSTDYLHRDNYIFPVFFLRSTAEIEGGVGTLSDPFIVKKE